MNANYVRDKVEGDVSEMELDPYVNELNKE